MKKTLLRSTESGLPARNADQLFMDLLEKYVHRVAEVCDISELVIKETVSQIDLSVLSSTEQRGFENWLNDSFYMRISIENALRGGKSVKAVLTRNAVTNKIGYSVRIA